MIALRNAGLLVIVLGLVSGGVALGDEPPRPEVDARLGPLLDEWQRRSSAFASLDVQFSGREHSDAWGDNPTSGRVVLLRDGRARLDLSALGDQGQLTNVERLIWAGREWHQYNYETRQHFVFGRAEKDRGRLPDLLALPFAWGMDRQELSSRFRIEIVHETADAWFLKATPLEPLPGLSSSLAFIQIDRATYLPRAYRVIDRQGKSYTDYRVTKIESDRPIPDDFLRVADEPGWKLVRWNVPTVPQWLTQFFRAVLVP